MIANDDTDPTSGRPDHQKPSGSCRSDAASVLAPWWKRWLLFNALIVITLLIALRRMSYFTDARIIKILLAYFVVSNLCFAGGPLIDRLLVRFVKAGNDTGRRIFMAMCFFIIFGTLLTGVVLISYFPHPSVDEVLAVSELPDLPSDAREIDVRGDCIGSGVHVWFWYFLRFTTNSESLQEFLSEAGVRKIDDAFPRQYIDDNFVDFPPNAAAQSFLPPDGAEAFVKNVDFHTVYVFAAGQTVYVATVSDD